MSSGIERRVVRYIPQDTILHNHCCEKLQILQNTKQISNAENYETRPHPQLTFDV
jgi:hypothetical protein